MEEVRKDVFWYIELCYNCRRRHSSLQYMTTVPVLGNAIGAAGGFVIGICIYAITDMTLINGKSVRNWIKEGMGGL